MNFSRGQTGTKVRCELFLFAKEKTPEFAQNGRNSWTIRFGPFFGLVCQGDLLMFGEGISKTSPWKMLRVKIFSAPIEEPNPFVLNGWGLPPELVLNRTLANSLRGKRLQILSYWWGTTPLLTHKSGREKQPKDRVLGQEIHGTSGTQTSGYPRQNFMQVALFCYFRQGGRDVPGFGSGRSGFGKTLCKKTLGWFFVPWIVRFLFPLLVRDSELARINSPLISWCWKTSS